MALWSFKRVRLPFYVILWLMTVSVMPLAGAQPIVPPQPIDAPSGMMPTTTTSAPSSPRPTPRPVTPTVRPTADPTQRALPTAAPTVSQQPIGTTTGQPTITPRPTTSPSTDFPSAQPSVSPTVEPTFAMEIKARTVFNQRFQIEDEIEFNETEKAMFCKNMEGYTASFGGRDDERVNTTCNVISQRLQIIGGSRRLGDGLNHGRKLQGVVFNQVEYGMSYASNHTNVTTYPTLFQNYVNDDLDGLTSDLQNVGLSVTNSLLAFNNIATISPTTIPTETPFPSGPPTTALPVPSMAPSPSFTRDPAINPETAAPSLDPAAPRPTGKSRSQGGVIAGSIIGALFLVVLLGLFVLFYRQRKRTDDRKLREQAAAISPATEGDDNGWNAGGARNDLHVHTGDPYNSITKNGKAGIPGMLSSGDSNLSRGSLVSAGDSPLSEASDREADGTHHLADEFDQFKDQNLEKMRSGVEDNLRGFDGMMSQALTKALMGDDDTESIDQNELRWGGSGDSIEIEATALYEVTDWLKRNEEATAEERSAFMQEMLDRMVASVRRGVMDPGCGSRAIHECAALLGLQLACSIQGNTLIVSGMPKSVQRNELLSAFREFGEIEAAAVAANKRGFGLVRFKSVKSVSAVMTRIRTSEILVMDVGVAIKVLKTDDSNRRGWPDSTFPPPPAQSASRHSSRAGSPNLK